MPTLSEKRAAAGRRGALRRWGDPANRTTVRLADLDPAEADVVRALLRLRAARLAAAADTEAAA